MRAGVPRLVGSAVTLILIIIFLFSIPQDLTPFQYAPSEKPLIAGNDDLGHALSQMLWGHRQSDVILLAIVLFVTGAACSSILRADRGEPE